MGLHLEGPYINPKKRGAHVEAFVRKANLEEVKQLLEFADGCVKMITLAPELQDDDVIDYLLSQQIILSLGHSDANFEQATRAFDGGVQTTTHLFNAMSPLNHRQPGVPTAVFNHPTAMASIIADGLHVDFELVKLAHKIMEERLFLITDAVTDCNIGPYQHQAVDGKFILPNGTLSGSALTMLQALQNCVNFCNVSLKNAINMASLYPAQLIGKETAIGSIYTGAYADFLVLDEHLSLEQVYFRGQEIISPTNEKN
jgi:N-acetylglucosamine-6-phosphate deacetylase